MSPRQKTSVDQLHGDITLQPEQGSDIRLFIDLDKCSLDECTECTVKCSYFFHPENTGINSIIELVTYALVCRQCEEPHCIKACPKDALEQLETNNRILTRYTVRCVSCRSCSHACPYGTIYPEMVPRMANICDYCLDRRDVEPVCIGSCPYGALRMVKGDIELGEDTFLIGDNLIVHSTHWNRDNA